MGDEATSASSGNSDDGASGAASSGELEDTGASPSQSTGSSGPSDSSGSSGSSGATLDDCPPAQRDVGGVTDVSLGDAWPMEARSEIIEATCDAIAYDGSALQLQCTRAGEDRGPHEVLVHGGGPVVGDALAAFVSLDDLQLSVFYVAGFFGPVLLHATVRTPEGELLLLSSVDYGGPGSQIAVAGADDFTAPFTELELVDHDCALRTNAPDTWPETYQVFALEIGTDTGTVPVFDAQQVTVQRDGIAYEASVLTAVVYPPCPADCPEAVANFSIVRLPR